MTFGKMENTESNFSTEVSQQTTEEKHFINKLPFLLVMAHSPF